MVRSGDTHEQFSTVGLRLGSGLLKHSEVVKDFGKYE